ncbi:MAG TPA: EamA family transporter [Bryobacteraceae bacterium]|jgi:transporter family protein
MQVPAALKAKWFWYSILSVVCMGGWTLLGKLGTTEISAPTMQFLYPFGWLPVALACLWVRGFRLERSLRGALYSISIGVLGGIGGLAFFAACRTGGNTSAITAATAMYPLITVVLAVLILREKLTWLHVAGLVFAAVAFVLFSL